MSSSTRLITILYFLLAFVPVDLPAEIALAQVEQDSQDQVNLLPHEMAWNYSPFLIRIKNASFDTFVLREFPSYATVLHDTAFRLGDRLHYIYGFWSCLDAMIDGHWTSLATPRFQPASNENDIESVDRDDYKSLLLKTVDAEDGAAQIITRYDFFPPFPGVRMSRVFEMDLRSDKHWGSEGYWLGGSAGDFPIYNTKGPSSYYYKGLWRNSPLHVTKDSRPTIHEIPDLEDRFVILYWDDTEFWLSILVDPLETDSIFSSLHFAFRGAGFSSPSWYSETGLFDKATLTSWFLVGKSDKGSAVQDVSGLMHHLTNPEQKGCPPPKFTTSPNEILSAISHQTSRQPFERSIESQKAASRSLSNGLISLTFDEQSVSIADLVRYSAGTERSNLMEGEATRIYFTGGSRWQRSLHPEDTDDRYLVTDSTQSKVRLLSSSILVVDDLLLLDPESREPYCKVDLDFRLPPQSASVVLTASCTILKANNFPYLGWHFDFPKDSFKWFSREDYEVDISRWDSYRMGYLDLQPMRYPFSHSFVTACPEIQGGTQDCARLTILEPTTTAPDAALCLPNPLFDSARGVQKIVACECRLDWSRHNVIAHTRQSGDKHVLTVSLELLNPVEVQRPKPAFIHVDLPHSSTVSEALDDFWTYHCQGGPAGFEGVLSWWHSLSGRFNPRLSLENWRACLIRYLENLSDGNQKTAGGWVVPAGGAPLVRRDDSFSWNNGYLFEVNAHLVLSGELYYLSSGDLNFLHTHIADMRELIDFYARMMDSAGIVILPDPFNGINGPTSCYWDGWTIGYQSVHIQMYAAAAAAALARMYDILNDEDSTTKYSDLASRLQKPLTTSFWREGDLADKTGSRISGGRLISWVNEGNETIDAGFTDLNLMAVYTKLLPSSHERLIYEWIDHDSHSYAWLDKTSGEEVGIITFNTIDGNSSQVYTHKDGPKRYYAGPFNPFSLPPGMENGQVQYWVAGFDFYNRARIGLGESAARKLIQFTKRYSRGDLTSGHGVPQSRPLPMFQGTSQMSPETDSPVGSDPQLGEDGLVYTLGLLSGIFGFECDRKGFYLNPSVPREFRDARITNLRYLKHPLRVQFQGWGNHIIEASVNGQTAQDLKYLIPLHEDGNQEDNRPLEIHVRLDKQ